MANNCKKIKWHKRHVTIDTPCHIRELESIVRAVAENGGWNDATVKLNGNKIVLTFGNEDEPDSEEDGTNFRMING